jgi:hypothetical protein
MRRKLPVPELMGKLGKPKRLTMDADQPKWLVGGYRQA